MSENNNKSYTERLVRVVTTKVIRLQVANESLTDEMVDEFSKGIFEVHRVDDLFEHAGGQIARFEDGRDSIWVEGIGPATLEGLPGGAPIQFALEDVNVEIEVME